MEFDTSGVGHINKATSSPVSTGIGNRYFPGLWVGAKSTDDGFGHCCGRNGEFCVAFGPVT